jgi:hypothetical protein
VVRAGVGSPVSPVVTLGAASGASTWRESGAGESGVLGLDALDGETTVVRRKLAKRGRLGLSVRAGGGWRCCVSGRVVVVTTGLVVSLGATSAGAACDCEEQQPPCDDGD